MSLSPGWTKTGGEVERSATPGIVRKKRESRRNGHDKLTEVAQFEFSSLGESYANKTGGASAALNVGVIGVATFEEENEELNIRKAADAFPAFATPPAP